MRPDQFARLQAVEEKLADLFVTEADPDNWPQAGEATHKIDSDERSNLFRCKRAAISTADLLVRTQGLMRNANGEGGPVGPDADRWLEKDIARAENAALAAVERAMAKPRSVKRA